MTERVGSSFRMPAATSMEPSLLNHANYAQYDPGYGYGGYGNPYGFGVVNANEAPAIPVMIDQYDLNRERAMNYIEHSTLQGESTGKTVGLLGGMATGACIGGVFFGPMGAAVGAIAGGLVGYFAGGPIGGSLAEYNAVTEDARDNGVLDGSPALSHGH